ncbi:hypothetical protein EDC18_101365 [Natranaerovirga pectinivora]|uniref:Uncharacterized protein n=1 Tax=Natranaerovirga pectinivora TaxID=682400 RepID=A0A4V2V0N7_9FIRM|nr:hypothetical protein [Natranaerovirga pectinivora]TCT17069.1 hypothetical protein EDC18_101365 [Natranaerovirga pectinivora]
MKARRDMAIALILIGVLIIGIIIFIRYFDLNFKNEENKLEFRISNKRNGEKEDTKGKTYEGIWLIESEDIKQCQPLIYVFGGMILDIQQINNEIIKGEISTIQSAPSNRIASVTFEALRSNNILKYLFSDDGWGNKGQITLEFLEDTLDLTIDLTDIGEGAMWGIGNGNFIFHRALPFEELEITELSRAPFEKYFSELEKGYLQPFKEFHLENDQLITFAILYYAYNHINATTIEKSEVDKIIYDFFGIKDIEHNSVFDYGIIYTNNSYTYPVVSGVSRIPIVEQIIECDSKYYIMFTFNYIDFETSGYNLDALMLATLEKGSEGSSMDYWLKEYKEIYKFD